MIRFTRIHTLVVRVGTIDVDLDYRNAVVVNVVRVETKVFMFRCARISTESGLLTFRINRSIVISKTTLAAMTDRLPVCLHCKVWSERTIRKDGFARFFTAEETEIYYIDRSRLLLSVVKIGKSFSIPSKWRYSYPVVAVVGAYQPGCRRICVGLLAC